MSERRSGIWIVLVTAACTLVASIAGSVVTYQTTNLDRDYSLAADVEEHRYATASRFAALRRQLSVARWSGLNDVWYALPTIGPKEKRRIERSHEVIRSLEMDFDALVGEMPLVLEEDLEGRRWIHATWNGLVQQEWENLMHATRYGERIDYELLREMWEHRVEWDHAADCLTADMADGLGLKSLEGRIETPPLPQPDLIDERTTYPDWSCPKAAPYDE